MNLDEQLIDNLEFEEAVILRDEIIKLRDIF